MAPKTKKIVVDKNTKKRALIKRYIKLIACNPDPVLNLSLLRAAPDEVIKTICNAAYNLTNSHSVQLTPGQKKYFRKYKDQITRLVQPGTSIRTKRQQLIQRGGGFFVPLLLSTVLPIVTSLLREGVFRSK